ncbi:energy transducer TonB [Methylopila sp. M107]|uniref:energy transducer TonB family protein n=1 Tax=Methylopila sp. M107 TaxID=1101190 RepID=UPI0006866150|nr:energy transducer TonB [Methylopila sp. M107]
MIGGLAATSATAQTAAPPADRKQWTAVIRDAFAAQKPAIESIRGVTGVLRPELSITIRSDGSVADVSVKRPSGFQGADDAAIQMVRNADPLPAFTADMPKDDLTFTLPVNFSFAPKAEEDARLFVDTKDGVRLEVQAPLYLRPVSDAPAFDAFVEVVAGKEPPPFAAAGEPICAVGFNKEAVGLSRPAQSELNAPDRLDPARDEAILFFSGKGLEVERSETTDYRSTKLVELYLKPKPGGETPDRRFYQASFGYPDGRVTIFCSSDEKGRTAALDAYRSIRDGFSFAPK